MGTSRATGCPRVRRCASPGSLRASKLMHISAHVRLFLILCNVAPQSHAVTDDVGLAAASLPMINVRYEYPIQDLEGGGPRQRNHEDLVAFKKRVAYLRGLMQKDAEVLSAFVADADSNLNSLGAVLNEVVRRSASLKAH